MVLTRFNTSIGISVTRKLMVFANTEHGNYYVNDFVFKNTGIVNQSGTVHFQSLDSVFFYFFHRFAFAGVTSPGYGQGWGAFSSQWGSSTINHAFGENPADVAFNNPTSILYKMRGFYSWYGPNNERPVSYAEDWGCPNESGDGVLGSAKYAGCVTLHADSSANNPKDDLSQPKTTWFISPDISIMSTDVSQYDETFMADRFTAMREGHPPKQHDELVGDSYPINYSDPRRQSGGGTGQGQGFGPYTLAPGDSIHIVFAEGVSGISWEKCREVGGNWVLWRNNAAALPKLTMPNGDTTTNYNLYKRKWCETGMDSILGTYHNAMLNYASGYHAPQPPPPPDEFAVSSDSAKIRLTWATNAVSDPHFNGYVICRSEGNVMGYTTVYKKIFECNSSNVVHSYNDTTAKTGIHYYYYVQSKDDGSTNDLHPGRPLYSSEFYTMTNHAASLGGPVSAHQSNFLLHAYQLSNNYPNPFNPSTTISFDLPSQSFVSLRVFDAIGREVATLVSEVLPEGQHFRQWNATNMPSGVYFYRLQAGSFIDTKKFVLLR